MHRGRPSARHEESVAGDSPILPEVPDTNGAYPETALDAKYRGARNNFDPRSACGVRQRALRLRTQIDDLRNADAGFLQIERRAIGAVVGRRDDDALAHAHAVLEAIAPR